MKREKQATKLVTTRREFLQGVGVTFSIGATGVIGACSMEPGKHRNPCVSVLFLTS